MGQTQSQRTTNLVGARGRTGRRTLAMLLLAVAGAGLVGCNGVTIPDYLNLRNSFLNPSEVGRFDKANPWGEARPVKWPILEQLDVVDEPVTHWTNATDPTPADLVPEVKELSFGVGDTLRVSVYELITPGVMYEREFTVNEMGQIGIHNLGNVQVSGLTPTQLEEKLKQMVVERGIIVAAGNGSPGPQVSVSLVASRQRVFSMLGAVGRPGTYNVLQGEFRLLDAIALAGDIPTTPGMDYIYVIRGTQYEKPAGSTEAAATAPAGTVPATTGATTRANPLGTIESLEPMTSPAATNGNGATTAPTTSPAPANGATGPQGAAPKWVRELPKAMVLAQQARSAGEGIQLAQADLDAALDPAMPATTAAPATAATTTATATAPAATAPATGTDSLMESAMSQPTTDASPQYVFIDGKLVMIPGRTGTRPSGTQVAIAPTTGPGATPVRGIPGELTPPAEQLSSQRVIRIPIQPLREGQSRYNIIIKPGDVINVPGAEPGEFYMMGHAGRAGVYTLTGRKVTLRQAIAAAGGMDGLAIPEKAELIRRIGTNQEVIVQVNLKKIFDGDQPDMFLKPNDVLNVGTDAIMPFLAVTRNAYRASYGWGFIYDKNFNNDNNNNNR